MLKATLGPWAVDENKLAAYGDNGPNFTIRADESGQKIATLPLYHKLLDHGETEDYLEAAANARLIAAAPELYEALCATTAVLTRLARGLEDESARTAVLLSNDALARARGDQ